MSLIEYTFFLERHSQPESAFPQTTVESHFFDATRKIKSLVGKTTWQDVSALTQIDPLSEDQQEKLEAFKRAEAEFTMMYLINKMNLKVGTPGVVVSSFSQDFGQGNFRIASQDEIRKYQAQYENRALELIDEYIPDSTVKPIRVGDDE